MNQSVRSLRQSPNLSTSHALFWQEVTVDLFNGYINRPPERRKEQAKSGPTSFIINRLVFLFLTSLIT